MLTVPMSRHTATSKWCSEQARRAKNKGRKDSQCLDLQCQPCKPCLGKPAFSKEHSVTTIFHLSPDECTAVITCYWSHGYKWRITMPIPSSKYFTVENKAKQLLQNEFSTFFPFYIFLCTTAKLITQKHCFPPFRALLEYLQHRSPKCLAINLSDAILESSF